MLSLIAVIGKNRELGKNNQLLWHIPGDLPRFKKITSGHPVIMGRKTFESIGKPLPDRTNIIITSDSSYASHMSYSSHEVIVVLSIEQAIEAAISAPGGREEVFVIGGAKVFAETIDRADRLYLTIVDATAEADVFFPEYSAFTKVVSEESVEAGGFKYSYITLER